MGSQVASTPPLAGSRVNKLDDLPKQHPFKKTATLGLAYATTHARNGPHGTHRIPMGSHVAP